ncbi:MAG TPA: glycosyltransferase [Armatimonadota bacterium]|nr:glycosyltransferase [Armatimonadota bacterium]
MISSFSVKVPHYRIIEYISGSSMGGAEHGVQVDARELRRRGHEILFVAPRGRKITRALQKEDFPLWSPKTYGKIDPVTLMRLIRVIRNRRIHLVHTHLSTASLIGSIAARVCRIPAVATVHGLNSAFCYRNSHLIVAVSQAVKDHLESQGIPGGRIRVVQNGINVARFQGLMRREEARAELGLPADSPIILYAGRLSPEKGVALLPNILGRVRERVPNALLVTIGEGVMQSEMEDALRKAHLEEAVRLMGYRADPLPFLAAADLLLLPSYREGLPRILLESMAAGLPAVASEAGGIPEAIEQDRTGKTAPIGDVEALADACVELLRDEELRLRMGAAACDRAERLFSVVKSVTELEQVFLEARAMGAVRG